MLSIRNTTRSRPRISFEKISDGILGSRYNLSLVLIADYLARRLNREHKGKDTPTNVLSFPIAKDEGEIFLNIRRAKRDAKNFGHSEKEHLAFLFIHGCLHLKGHKHGTPMEILEKKYLKKYLERIVVHA